MKDSVQITLKRTQAIPDLHSMNDYSESPLNETSSSPSTKLDTPIVDSLPSSKSIDFIEENKVLMDGINVRAADLAKLIQFLIDSFGSYIFSSFVINSNLALFVW